MTWRMRGLVCACLVLAACEANDRPKASAPDFRHPDLDGHPVRLSELRGQTVVIDFFATWCGPCVLQPAELNRVWKSHRDSGKLVVLGIETSGATADEVRAWAADNQAVADYSLLTGADVELAWRYGVSGLPATVVVDPDGKIDSVMVGVSTADEIEERIAAFVGS